MQEAAIVTEQDNLLSSGLLTLQASRTASIVHSAAQRYVLSCMNFNLKIFRPLLQDTWDFRHDFNCFLSNTSRSCWWLWGRIHQRQNNKIFPLLNNWWITISCSRICLVAQNIKFSNLRGAQTELKDNSLFQFLFKMTKTKLKCNWLKS